jgi:ATP-binding cassette subfamily B (MDR/TAP) protein 1
VVPRLRNHAFYLQFGAFAMSGSQLTQRVRVKAFENLLCQEVAFFDRSENSSGAIAARLSSDAMAVQQMIGTRLGIVFETVTMLSFGLIIGYLFNWKLTSVFLSFVILVLCLAFLDIRSQAQLNKYNSTILGQSSSVRLIILMGIATQKNVFILSLSSLLSRPSTIYVQ